VSLHYNRSAINSGCPLLNGTVYIADADWQRIQYSVLLQSSTRSRILSQNRGLMRTQHFGIRSLLWISSVAFAANRRYWSSSPRKEWNRHKSTVVSYVCICFVLLWTVFVIIALQLKFEGEIFFHIHTFVTCK